MPQTSISKTTEHNLTKIGVHALRVSINQNMRRHFDSLKWAWPLAYMLINQDAN